MSLCIKHPAKILFWVLPLNVTIFALKKKSLWPLSKKWWYHEIVIVAIHMIAYFYPYAWVEQIGAW